MFYIDGLRKLRQLKSYYQGDTDQAMMRLSTYVDYAKTGQLGNGQISDKERDQLIDWVVESAETPGPIVEIGTLLGFSTQALCEAVIKSGRPKKVITVDNYGWNPMGVPSFRHKMLTKLNLRMASRLTELNIIDSDAEQFYQSFTEIPSFVFIDADHSYASVKKDLQFFHQIGTPVITGHDYNFPDVARAVHEVLGRERLSVFDGTLFKYDRR